MAHAHVHTLNEQRFKNNGNKPTYRIITTTTTTTNTRTKNLERTNERIPTNCKLITINLKHPTERWLRITGGGFVEPK